MGLVDKDGDGVKAWDGKGNAPSDATTLDQDDSNPKVGAPNPSDSSSTDTEYAAWLAKYGTTYKPSISVSTKDETTADINAAFQAAFGENASKEVIKAYYNEIHGLQVSRVSGGGKPTDKITVNTQGVSGQEIKSIIEKYVGAAASDKINAAQTGDPAAVAALQRGSFGVVYTKLNQAYQDNGIPMNPKTMGKLVTESIANTDKLNANLNLVNLQAKTFYPALADKIGAGYSVKQLLSPYLQTRASILEEDADNIDLKSLQSVAKDPNGLMNLYDYEVSLRNDPKWRFTKNAQDSMSSVATGIAKMFGLVG